MTVLKEEKRRRSQSLLEDGGGIVGSEQYTLSGEPQDAQQQHQQQPVYDVFLGGSCGNTCWRSDIVIPYLNKRAISYYDPQRPVWSENMILEEQRAKENSRIFLFVLDPGTINATSFLEIAYFAARKASKLVVVFLGRHEWSDKALKVDLPDRIRTCNLLEAILKRHSVLMLTSIGQAVDFVDEKIIGDKPWAQALANSAQRLPFIRLKSRRCANRCSSRCQRVARFCRNRLTLSHLCRLAALLAFEALLVLAFNFLVAPLLSTASSSVVAASSFSTISVWALILPLLAFNYLLLLGLIVYYRFQSHRKRRRVHRTLQLPMPPLPRVNTASSSLASSATTTAAERREKSFRARRGNSSQSSSSVVGMNGGYEPMIELLISGTTSGNNSQHQRRARTYSHQPSAEERGGRKSSPLEQEYCNINGNNDNDAVSAVASAKLRTNGCLTSPIGYDVFLSCSSSSELDWITQKAVPELHRNGLSYTSALMCDNDAMRIPFLHTASHILYYIPSYKTFLSGMIEIAYFIGHADWQVTVCVPREAECLVLLDDVARLDANIYRAVERRNECYRMAFSYLKDMASRRQVRVFTRVEEAIRHIRDTTHGDRLEVPTEGGDNGQQSGGSTKRTALRQILEKQHLVKERTSTNLLAHLKECEARGQPVGAAEQLDSTNTLLTVNSTAETTTTTLKAPTTTVDLLS